MTEQTQQAASKLLQAFGPKPLLVEASRMAPTYSAPVPAPAGSIAVIDVCGVLTEQAYAVDEYFGWATRYSTVIDAMRAAGEDPNIIGRLLRFNSPGGDTDLAFEAADELRSLCECKPTWALAMPHCYSAAYLLASQCDQVWCPPKSGGVGSVGVYTAHIDYSEALAQAGIKVTLISEGAGKTDGNPYEPLTDEARADIQASVAKAYGYFVDAVARGRNVKAAALRKIGAKIFEGADAIAAGYADATGTEKECLAAFFEFCRNNSGSSSSTAASAVRSTKEAPGEMGTTNEQRPADATTPADAVTAARAAGYGEAAEIADLCAIAGKPGLAAEFITARKTVGEVRAALLAGRVNEGAEGGELVTHVTALAGTGAKPAKSLGQIMAEMVKAQGR